MRRSQITILAAVFVAIQAQAAMVYFGDANRGPSNPLTIGDVTVSGASAGGLVVGGLPATVAGYGLGSALIGAPYSVDCLIQFGAGSSSATEVTEGLQLSALGTINSITVIPHATVSYNGGASIPLGLQFAMLPDYPTPSGGGGPFHPPQGIVLTGNGVPVTINSPQWAASSMGISVVNTDGDEVEYIINDRLAHLSQAATYDLSFTIQSINITPVPESSTFIAGALALLPVGFTALRSLRKRQLA